MNGLEESLVSKVSPNLTLTLTPNPNPDPNPNPNPNPNPSPNPNLVSKWSAGWDHDRHHYEVWQ